MKNFSTVPGSFYGVSGSDLDVNVRFFGGDIHTINPLDIRVTTEYSYTTPDQGSITRCTIKETKLCAVKMQLHSLIQRHGGMFDISLTTSQEFDTPGLLLMEFRKCRIERVEIHPESDLLITSYDIIIGEIFDVGDPAPWDPPLTVEDGAKTIKMDLPQGNAGTVITEGDKPKAHTDASADYDDSFVR